MKIYIEDICLKIGFDSDSIAAFLDAYDSFCKSDEAKSIFDTTVLKYEQNSCVAYDEFCEASNQISQCSGVHRYTVRMVIMLAYTKNLLALYRKAGYTDTMYYDMLVDLRCKNGECRTIHGLCGSFVSQWQMRIFNMKLFCFGRLEYEPKKLDKDVTLKDSELKCGIEVICVHIPSSGRLDIGQCRDSLKQAYKFFCKNEPVIFYCNSWLLYPKNCEIISGESNILKFAQLFEIVSYSESTGDLWRIFGTQDTDNYDALPEDTSLRRAFKRYLQSGKKPGVGCGYITEGYDE